MFDTGLVEPPPYGVLKNDSDPEGDTLSCVDESVDTLYGNAHIYPNGKATFVQAANGETGDAIVSYTVCDNLGACSNGTITFHVVNHAPIALPDIFIVRGPVFGSPLDSPPYGVLKNDFDPDGDSIQTSGNRVDFAQGTGIVYYNGRVDFVRNNGYLNFTGLLSMQYPLQDSLGAISYGTVFFVLIGPGENDGAVSCKARAGGPVNVTSGNMHLQQSDYSLPSVGPGLDVTRTYNSNSSQVGLFGPGWSTAYDQSISVY